MFVLYNYQYLSVEENVLILILELAFIVKPQAQ